MLGRIGMTDTNVKNISLKVAEIIISELKLTDITPETFNVEMDLIDELGIDSMDLTTIVLLLQDEFGITIDEDDYPKLNNIRKIAEYIKLKCIRGDA
jgi:acyl carrier protein